MDYEEKLEFLRSYIPFLRKVIHHLQVDIGPGNEGTLCRLKKLCNTLQDPLVKPQLATLQRCGDLLKKLHEKFKHLDDKNNNAWKLYETSAEKLEADTNNFEQHSYQLLEMSKVSKQFKDGSTSEETMNLPKPFTCTNQVEELILGTLEGYSTSSEPNINISDAPNTRSNTRHCISHLPEIYKDFEQQQNNTISEEQVNLPSTSKCMTQEHTINEVCQEDCSTDGEFLVDVLDKMSVKIGFKKFNYHMPEMSKISKRLQNYKNSLNLGNMSSTSRCITQEEEMSTISGNDYRANTESKVNILNTLNCKGDLKNYNSHLLKMLEDSLQLEDEVCTEEQIKRTAEDNSVEYRSSSESTSNLNLPLAFECMLKEKEVTVDVSVSDLRESSESKLSVSESQKNDLTTTNLEKYRKVPLPFISSVVEELEKKEPSIPASGVNIFTISNTDNNLIVESSINPCCTKNDDLVSKNKEYTENKNNVKHNVVINCVVSECMTDRKPETDQTDGACLYEEGDLDVFLNGGIDSVNSSKNSAKATRPNDFYITSKEPVENDINKQKLGSENEGNAIPVDLRCNINKCDVESFHTDNIFVKNHDCVNKVGVNKENNIDSFNTCNRRSTTNFISERYNIFSGKISVGNLASISSCDKESMGESASKGIRKEKRTMLSGTRTNFEDISTKNVKSILNQISQASYYELDLSYQTLGEVLTNENLTFEGYENSEFGCNKVRNKEKMLFDDPINKNVSGSLDIEEISQNDYSDCFAGKLTKEYNEENKVNEIADSSGLISENSSGCFDIPPSSHVEEDGSNDQLLSSHMGEGESSNQIVSKRANRNVAEETCQLSEMYEGVQKSSYFKNRHLCDQKKEENSHKVLREDGTLVRDNRNYQKSFEKEEHCQNLSCDKITSENVQKIVMKPVSVVISRLLSLEKYVKNNLKSNQNSQNERIRNNENSFDKLHEGNEATITKDLTYACTLCTFTTTDEKVFANHVKVHPISVLTSWCKKCQRVFPNVGKLVHHIQTSCTGSFDACIKCGVALCNFETKSPLQFYHHNRFKHRGYLRLNCNTCDKFFSMPHCLTLHVQDECLKLEDICKQPKEGTKDEITSHQRNEQDFMCKAVNVYKDNSDDPECISSQMLNSYTSSQKILQNPSDSIYLVNCFGNQNLGKLIILKKLSPDKESAFSAGEECQVKNLISHTLTQVQVTAKNTCEVENHATEMNNKSSKQATCKKGASPEDDINNASVAMVGFSEYWKGISTAEDKSTDESKKLIIDELVNSESKKCKEQTECCKEQSFEHKKDSSESRNATTLVDDSYSQDDSSKMKTKITAHTTHNKNQDFPLLLACLRTEWFSKDPDCSDIMTDVLTFSKKMEDRQSLECDHPILDMQVEVGKEPTVSKNTSTIQGFPEFPESKELSLALDVEEENFKYLCRDFEYEANLFSSALSREKPKVTTNNDELMEHAVPTFVLVGDKQYENKTNSKPAEFAGGFSCISTNNPIRNTSEDLEESRIEYKHLEEDVKYEGKCAMESGVSDGKNLC
ncbi:uncharacterized protein LOC143244533 isoform X2 [Tachypleus tridentatus]